MKCISWFNDSGIKVWLGMGIILLLAIFSRFYHLGYQSLWVDEVVASYVASGPDLHAGPEDIKYIYQQRFNDVTPPLRDYLAHYSFRLFGVNEFALRFFPAFFGVLGIALIGLVARKWFNDITALICSFLLLISPFHLHHSQDGRMYTIFIFLSLSAFYCLHQIIFSARDKKLWWAGFILANILNIYLSYFGFWCLCTQYVIALAWILMESKGKDSPARYSFKWIGYFSLALLGLFILYLPWVKAIFLFIHRNINSPVPYQLPFTPPVIDEETSRNYIYHLKPDWKFLKELLEEFGQKGFMNYLYILFFLTGVKTLFTKNMKLGVGISLWLLIPLIITFAPPAKALFFNRYISFMMPVYIMAVGIGFIACIDWLYKHRPQHSKMTEGAFIFLAVIFITAATLTPIKNHYLIEKQEWKKAVGFMIPQLKDKDVIITGPYNSFWSTMYYLQRNGARRSEVYPAPWGGEYSELNLNGKIIRLCQKIQDTANLTQYYQNNNRVWYISAYYRTYQYRNPSYYSLIENQSGKYAKFESTNKDDSIYVFLYDKSEPLPVQAPIFPSLR